MLGQVPLEITCLLGVLGLPESGTPALKILRLSKGDSKPTIIPLQQKKNQVVDQRSALKPSEVAGKAARSCGRL